MSDTYVSKITVNRDEAALFCASHSRTRAKVEAASGATISVADVSQDESRIEVRGTREQVAAGVKYAKFCLATLKPGGAKLPEREEKDHDDLHVIRVPAESVPFVAGKQGMFIKHTEEHSGTVMFFLGPEPSNRSAGDRLAIFGQPRGRLAAQLKIMTALETKHPGQYTKERTAQPTLSEDEGLAVDSFPIKEQDYSYALGQNGTTRKKIARASECIVEYVGNVAFFGGTKIQRSRAREYLGWLLQQKSGPVHVDFTAREDCSCVMVDNDAVGYVTGHKGSSLHAIEDETGTFCLIEGELDCDNDDPKPLLIFGPIASRRMAESAVYGLMKTKADSRKGKGGKSRDLRRDGYGSWKENDGRGKSQGKGDRGKGKHAGETISITIGDEDAAFLMGPQGRTKRKIAHVSRARLEVRGSKLEITGTEAARAKALRYVGLVKAQRVGPVTLPDGPADDLTIVEVPPEAVSFVTGQRGSFLRLVEEEFGTLLFFVDFARTNRRDRVERLAIFGDKRSRRGAQLKVMAAIEMKCPSHFTSRPQILVDSAPEGFGTEIVQIAEDDYSYALGKEGKTRKKLVRASGCVIEYVGHIAVLSGSDPERQRGREYLQWLFQQRVGGVEVDYRSRDDCTAILVPRSCIGFVTGSRGSSLREVEDLTGTFCFIEGGRDDERDPKPLLIFGAPEARAEAEELLQDKIHQKLESGWVSQERYGKDKGDGRYSRGYDDWDGGREWEDRPRKGTKGKGKGKGKGSRDTERARIDRTWNPRPEDRRGRGDTSDNWRSGPEVLVSSSIDNAAVGAATHQSEVQQWPVESTGEDWGGGEGWGDWGGSDEEDFAVDALAPDAAATQQPQASWAKLLAAAPQHQAKTVVKPFEDEPLPPQLVNEAEWPDLGPGMGAKKKGR
mmetsp:Transcript_51990/g.137586  ORF Transcript_51990/g.137586 Transcript_51990/m.137586 type:complete len:898 (-) Transcript_51990:304-2997(-)